MSITNQILWDSWGEKNQDPYGGTCVAIAKRAMEILDAEPGEFNASDLIQRADIDGWLSMNMAGYVASMIIHCHSRGEEFRKNWNGNG